MILSLTVGRKPRLFGIIFGLPIVVRLQLLIQEKSIANDFGQQERSSAEYIKQVSATAHVMIGDISTLEKRIEEDAWTAQEVDARYGKEFKNVFSAGVLDDLLVTRIDRFNQRRGLSFAIVRITAVVALLFIASIGRSISKPLADLKEVTDRINKGDLSTSTDINRRDEIGQLAESLNRLQKTLQTGGEMKTAA